MLSRSLLVMLVFCLLSLKVSAVEFINFDKLERLSAFQPKVGTSKGYSFFEDKQGNVFATRQALILKTRVRAFGRARIPLGVVKHAGFAGSELLAQFNQFAYFMVTLKPAWNEFSVAGEIMQLQGVLLAQPDILQLTKNKWFFSIDKEKEKERKIFYRWKDRIHFSEAKLLLNKQALTNPLKIAIIDNGFDFTHPDLAKPVLAFNVTDRSYDVSPNGPAEKHGTLVAGILFADSRSKQLSVAVDGAEFIAIKNTLAWTSDIILSFYTAYLAGADIINCSWGLPVLLEPVADVVQEIATSGRQGLGTVIVFGIGNKKQDVSNSRTIQASSSVVSVAGVDKYGHLVTSYGSTVDVAAPTLLPTIDSRDHAIVGNLGGASAAAPVVSAVIGLMLQVNPNLSIAQIKTILGAAETEPQSVLFQQYGFNMVDAYMAVHKAASR